MSNEEQDSRASGSVPNAFGNAIAWKWSREMPPALKRSGLLTLLYALRSMANAGGELRFSGDRKPIRIQDIAKAAGADEKDARDRLEAAIRAGVVTVKGERRRGVRALYVVVLSPRPDWSAAASYLDGVKQLKEEAKQKRADRKAAPWAENAGEEFGGRSPELDEPKFGGPPPELTGGTENKVRGTAPRPSSGDRPPNGSGDRPPNNPGVSHEGSQDGAEGFFQPQVVGRSGTTEIDSQDKPRDHDSELADFARCARCHQPMIARSGRTTHTHCRQGDVA
ncbi:hypothetical protein ACFXKI_09940 [Streptomyces mirabilis]|uniref:hypothetical protein n=1 Tax=Streptomyces mirabilis TaxID=68239 RepID=UPI0036A65DF1